VILTGFLVADNVQAVLNGFVHQWLAIFDTIIRRQLERVMDVIHQKSGRNRKLFKATLTVQNVPFLCDISASFSWSVHLIHLPWKYNTEGALAQWLMLQVSWLHNPTCNVVATKATRNRVMELFQRNEEETQCFTLCFCHKNALLKFDKV